MVDSEPVESAGPGTLETPTVQFYIPATSSLIERRPRTLKHGDTFGLFDHYGDIVPGTNAMRMLFSASRIVVAATFASSFIRQANANSLAILVRIATAAFNPSRYSIR